MKNATINKLTFIYIYVPVLLFFLGYLKLLYSIFLVLISVYIYYRFYKSNSDSKKIKLKRKEILVIISISMLWVLLAGIGKFMYQGDFYLDHVIKNSIYKDLIFNNWPSKFSNGTYLSYYIGFYLVPASITKYFFFLHSEDMIYLIGNIIIYLYSCLGIILLFINIKRYLKLDSIKSVVFVLVSFILYSGLDVVGQLLFNGWPLTIDQLFFGFEWWTRFWQYPSITSSLFWANNQMIIPLLAIILCHNDDNKKNSVMYLVFALISGPFTIFGFVIYLIIREIYTSIKNKNIKNITDYISIQNILSITFILSIIIIFLISNKVVHSNELYVFKNEFLNEKSVIVKYIAFIFLEFLIYIILIFKDSRDKTKLIIIAIVLLLLPFKEHRDFVMRVGFSFIFLLWLEVVKFILNKKSKKAIKFILITLLVISSVTPLIEIVRAVYYTVSLKRGSTVVEIEIVNINDPCIKNYVAEKNSFFFKYLAK